MKKTTCSQIGGPETCNEVFVAATAEEMITNAWKHLQEAHPEQAENIQKNPQDVNDKWMAEFKETKFPALADAEEAPEEAGADTEAAA